MATAASTSALFKALSDETRLRIVGLLQAEELAVHELQAVINLKQSTVSSHLATLRAAGILRTRREGKSLYYGVNGQKGNALLAGILPALRPSVADQQTLAEVRRRRKLEGRDYFDQVAGSFGRNYLPGRTWEGLARALLWLQPPLVVADLGVGSGELTLLLAQSARRLIAVDFSQAILDNLARKAQRLKLRHLEYRLGDLHELPLAGEEVDLVVLSQTLHHLERPKQVLSMCQAALRPGGRILILDLMAHKEQWVVDQLKHRWMGFQPAQLSRWLVAAGFKSECLEVVARDHKPPHFRTLMAVARR